MLVPCYDYILKLMKQKKIKIVAEAGCNHNGNVKMAFKLIDL